MAQQTRPDLHAAVELRFPDNTTGEITPADVRDFLHALLDSAQLPATDGQPAGLTLDQVQEAAAQQLLASAQTGISIMRDVQTGRLAITNTQPDLRELFFTCPASGAGNLQRYEFRLRYPMQEGAYAWVGDSNIAQIEFQAQGQPFSGTIEQFRSQTFSLFFNSTTTYSALITPVNVNQPCVLEMVQL